MLALQRYINLCKTWTRSEKLTHVCLVLMVHLELPDQCIQASYISLSIVVVLHEVLDVTQLTASGFVQSQAVDEASGLGQ